MTATPVITVGRWVDEDGRTTRSWYWEIRAGDQVVGAGLLDNTRRKPPERHTEADAWRTAARSLALTAYQQGLADRDGCCACERLDRIVSLVLVTDTMQGACCARGRRQAEQVIRIARGEDAALEGAVAGEEADAR